MSAKRLVAKQTRSDRRAAQKQAKQSNIERRWLKALAEAPKMRDSGELNDEGGEGDDDGGDGGFFGTPPIDEQRWMITDDDERDDDGSDDGYFRAIAPPQIY